jgi:hypothetical protein
MHCAKPYRTINYSDYFIKFRRKKNNNMSELKEYLLPVLKRNSRSNLNFKVFEKGHSKSPKIIRYSKLDNNFPKIGMSRDTSSYRSILDVRRKAEANKERLSHRADLVNLDLSVRGFVQEDTVKRVSLELIPMFKKRYQKE